MKLALFASSFYPHLGGVEELARQLSKEYKRRGHKVIVVTNQWPPSLPGRETYEGITVYRLPMRVPDGPVRAHLRFYASHHRVLRLARTILRQNDIDVIHVQCVSSNGYYAQMLARQLSVPLVVTSQGERTMDAEDIYSRSAFLNVMLRDLLRNADYVTACSRATMRDLEDYLGGSLASRGRVIYNGISLSDFDEDGSTAYARVSPYVLAMGRWVPQKGFDLLIRAFAHAVQAPGFDHDLLLAGGGRERPRLEEMVSQLGLSGRVRLVGAADREQAVSLFKGCSFVVVPSRREPLGIVNLEAMAARKPVIASEVGGIPEIVHHERNGLLVPPENVEALAAAMSRLAGDRRLRGRLGEAGRAFVTAFAWPKIAAEYEDVYVRVTRPVGAPPPPIA